ncbi:ubinuclein-1-like isoform X5 [Branchiostoma lanceolatum]|uniref:ubinuclein-1-like isoform X5 n=1 Tax=Branchiostoma lanceolatum TaxID=7740 RepID=UPI00345119B2
MAEAKRIVPIPLKGVKPLSKEKKEKSSPPRAPTLRFALSLTASTDKTCPELSYVDLVRNAMCKDKDSRPTPNKDVQVVDPDDPFAAADAKEMDDVERIARHFEEKYGPSTVSKVKGRRRDRIEDLVDMGLGYDETDPFVDNSECYDELVPADITTKLGGFYINSGVLEFRDVSDSDSEGNFKAPGVKRKTPKILSDSDDSGGDFKDATKKKRKIRKPSKDGVEKDGVRKRKRLKDPLDPNKPKKPRKPREKGDGTTKPRKKSTPTVAELLQRQQQLHQPGQNPLSTSNSTSPPSAGLQLHNSNVSPSNLLNSAGFGTLGDAASSLLTSSILSGLGDGSQGAGDGINPEKPPNLPTGLPGDLQTTIVKLKENMLSVGQLRSFPSLSATVQPPKAAEMSSDGKCKFFTPSVNSMLLDVEMQSRELKCSERSGVFAHLAAHLPCTKDTLLKRAKKLRHSELDSQLREPLFRLREAIGKVMPDQIRRHQEECKIATQAKLEQLQESQQTLQKEGEQENAGSTSDEDEEGNKNSLDNIKIKRSSMPRRKFEWTNEIRTLLYEVVRIKVQHYDRSRSQSAEEYLKTYMEQEVKNCWPKGWMQARMLFKESRCIHSCITAQPPKQKKIQVNPAPKKTAIIKFGLDHPPHVWGWSQQVGQTDPWDPAVSRQERKAPSPVVLPSGAVVAGGNIGGSNSTPPRTSPSQTFPKPVPMATSSSALQSMSLFASCVAAEKQQVTSVVSSPPSALPNAPTLTSSISSFIPTLLDYADLDGKMKHNEPSPRLGDSPTDNSIGHAIDAVVRQARSHSQPAQDFTAAMKTSPLQQSTGAVKKPAGDVVRPTMKSPPNASSQVQQQQRPSSAEMRSQFGKSFQALFEQSIQQPAGFNYPLARHGEGDNSQPARQQAAAPHKVPTTTSPYAQFQAHTQSSQPKAKPLSFVKPHFQTSTQSQAPLFSSKSQPQTATQAPLYSSKGQPQTATQAPLYSSKGQPQTATQAPLYSSKSQPQTSPQAPLYSSKGQPQTSTQASMFSSKSQTQTSPQAPLYSSKGQPQTSPQAPLYSSKGQSYPSQSQGQTSPFERTTQGSPKIGMSLTHGNQASLTHGNQASLAQGTQSSLTHNSQSSLTHGKQSSLTHSNQSSLTHGNQPSLTQSNQSSLTHTNQSSLTHSSQSSLTHGNQARQSGLSHSSPNLSPHGQGYNSTSPLSHQKSTGYTPTSPLSHQKPAGYTPTSPLSHQKPAGYTPTSPLSHQKPAGYTPTSPQSHQKPTGYSSSSPKFTSSSLASMGGITPDLSSFQLPGLNSIPQTTQRGLARPSLSQSQLTHPTTQALPVYQMGLADPRRDQASTAGGQRVVSDAIITGPAPGTYNHVQAYGPGRGTSSKVKGQPPTVNFQAGGSLPPFGTLRSSPTRQPYPGNQFSQAFSDIMACLSRPGSGGSLPKEAKSQSHSSSNNSTSPHRQIQ